MCSGDPHWCGVKTSNLGVFRGTGVQFSLLSDFYTSILNIGNLEYDDEGKETEMCVIEKEHKCILKTMVNDASMLND